LQRLRGGFVVLLVATAIPAIVTGADPATATEDRGRPFTQRIDIDDSGVHDEASVACDFTIEYRDVGRAELITFANGDMDIHQQGVVTFAAPGFGTALEVGYTLQVEDLNPFEVQVGDWKEVHFISTYRGLNYRVVGADSPFVSSGRGVVEVTILYDEFGLPWDVSIDEVFTPNLEHLFAVLCDALDGSGIGRGGISGTIRDSATRAPLADICVEAYEPSTGHFVAFALSGTKGRYEIRLLRAGRYKVRFVDCGDGSHAGKWYQDRSDFSSADEVIVGKRTTPGIDASLDRQGISGTVTNDGTGEPLGEICVIAYEAAAPRVAIAAAITTTDGTYFVGTPWPEDWVVQYRDCRDAAVYVEEYYDDQPTSHTATPITVGSGEVASGIDAGLSVGGTIEGIVTVEEEGAPLDFVCVGVSNAQGDTVAGALTAGDGSFSIGGLRDDIYFVGFDDCFYDRYAPEWWNDRPNRGPHLFSSGDPIDDGADPVHVELATVTPGTDAGLSPQGIAGTITDAATGEPADCVVEVWSEFIDGYATGRHTFTGPDGTYVFGSLPATTVYVGAVFCPGYLEKWYDGASEVSGATRIDVQPKTVVHGIDIQVDRGGSISGTVTAEATGEPIDACIEVRMLGEADRYGFAPLGGVCTESDGSYLVDALPPGDVAVSFYAEGYGVEWYDDQPDSAHATPVSVVSGVETSGVNAALEVGGSIRGTLFSAATGEPVPWEWVQVFTMAGDRIGWDQAGADGIWEIGNLQTGSYGVEVQVEFDDTLASGFFDGEIDLASADPVAVVGGERTEIVEFLPGGGTVTGIVNDAATGEPIVDACAIVYSLAGEEVGRDGTDEEGRFRTRPIRTGQYRVFVRANCFGDPTPYADEWYSNQPDEASADVITVIEGQETPGIDAGLDLK
jgi:hypothetical protein